MSRYRKIDPRIWNDRKFRELSDKGKLVFFMLLTHPNMTALGAMRATVSGLAEELGWDAEAFREAFREGCTKGMAQHDPKACLVALPNFIRYNPPESPNVIKAWVSALDLLPECDLKTRVIAGARAFAEGMSKAFAEALPEAFAKGMPYQEQEQEQEQEEQQQLAVAEATAPDSGDEKTAERNSVCDVILGQYHETLPACQRIGVLTPKRQRKLLAADKLARKVCRERAWPWDRTWFWGEYFGQCKTDPWLRGELSNPKNPRWKQNIEILVDDERFGQIMDRALADAEPQGVSA